MIARFQASPNEWDKLVASYADLGIMQTWAYGEAKRKIGGWQPERLTFNQNGNIVGAVQTLTKPIPFIGGGLTWINQGPLWQNGNPSSDTQMLLSMLAKLREYYTTRRKTYLRIAPNVATGSISDEEIKKSGYSAIEDSEGWYSAKIDLQPSLEDIRKGLARKWRGDLNAAEKRGAVCIIGRSETLFNEFLAHYEPFIINRKIATQLSAKFLNALQNQLPADRKMWLFEGRFQGEHLGGLLVATYGDTALALAGSNPTGRGRELKSGNLVWWKAIEKMKKLGLRWLDVGGTSPAYTSEGILHFKNGLNGQSLSLIKEFEASRGGILDRLVQWHIRRSRTQ